MNLAGLRVLVTRPAHQAEALCAAIDAAGGHALRQPLLSIKGPANGDDVAKVSADLAQATDADDLIFTSANAVDWAWQIDPRWRPSGRAFAVGRATARALTEKIPGNVHAPDSEFSSAGLLALPELAAPETRKIAIITGEDGRQELAQTLKSRDALVTTIAVYRRENVSVQRARLQALLGEVDVIFISSGQSLQHLLSIAPATIRNKLLQLQLVVPSSRVVKLALELGFSRTPLHPARMQNDAIVATLQQCTGRGSNAVTQLGE